MFGGPSDHLKKLKIPIWLTKSHFYLLFFKLSNFLTKKLKSIQYDSKMIQYS